jgi:hypothetical protein
MFGIEAERRAHNDWRCTGDRDETDLEILLFGRAGVSKRLGRRLKRKELRDRSQRRGGPDRFQERPARGIFRKHCAHHG